ncbi:hypothetical protein C8J56DRAFT_785901 [Mycena floridula]|nr:hypothetical protein C8J56DRAFT_785901 [Mycena floridula]
MASDHKASALSISFACSKCKLQAEYHKWCKENDFPSKLEEDITARQDEAANKRTQSHLNVDILKKAKSEEIPVYTNSRFRESLLRWMIVTNQPLRASEEPSFRDMIQLVATAKGPIVFPDRKACRREIIRLCNKVFLDMKENLFTSAKLQLTCQLFAHFSL